MNKVQIIIKTKEKNIETRLERAQTDNVSMKNKGNRLKENNGRL